MESVKDDAMIGITVKTTEEISSMAGFEIEAYMVNVNNVDQWNAKREQVKEAKGIEYVTQNIDASLLIRRALEQPNFKRAKKSIFE